MIRLAARMGRRRAQALRGRRRGPERSPLCALLLGMLGKHVEELADHGKVVRVARALLPPPAIPLPFEDPRVCMTLRNNISSVGVAKATES